jgi:hypothetical protein
MTASKASKRWLSGVGNSDLIYWELVGALDALVIGFPYFFTYSSKLLMMLVYYLPRNAFS